MNLARWGLAVLSVSSAVGCRSPELASPEANYGDSSFQIHAPSQGRWVRVKMPEGMGVAFHKESDGPDSGSSVDSAAAAAQFGEVSRPFDSKEELFESIRRAKIAQASFGALTPIRNDFRLAKFKGADCLFFKQKMNDAGKTRSVQDDLILSVEGMTCLHPKDPKKFVNMEFSRRYPRQSPPPETGADEMSYFNRLTFR